MDQLIGVIIFILIAVAQVIKAIKEAAADKNLKTKTKKNDDRIDVSRPKQSQQPGRQSKSSKQRLSHQPPLPEKRNVLRDTNADSSPQKALVKRLTPQGEGKRFEADPGTLDTGRILAPTIDPTVRPELESMTGIYEQGVMFADSSASAMTLDVANLLTKPEGIVHAVILAEILNRPAWQESSRQQNGDPAAFVSLH